MPPTRTHNETPVVIRPVHIHHPVTVDIVPRYNEPIARSHVPLDEPAPFQPNTEPLPVVPVAASHVIVERMKEIHHAPLVVPPTNPVQIVVSTPQCPDHAVEAPVVQRADRPETHTPVPLVTPEHTNGTSTVETPVEVPKPEVEAPSATSDVEVVSSQPEETTSRRKLKVYNGEGGRIHTEKQIEEILDWYLQTGELPDYVSERQRYAYRHHRSLLERRHLLEQRGISIVVHEVGRQPTNVVPLAQRTTQSQKRKTGSL